MADLVYVPPAALIDVAFEQLDYLLAHGTVCNGPGSCETCRRLTEVTRLLLTPFQEKLQSSPKKGGFSWLGIDSD